MKPNKQRQFQDCFNEEIRYVEKFIQRNVNFFCEIKTAKFLNNEEENSKFNIIRSLYQKRVVTLTGFLNIVRERLIEMKNYRYLCYNLPFHVTLRIFEFISIEIHYKIVENKYKLKDFFGYFQLDNSRKPFFIFKNFSVRVNERKLLASDLGIFREIPIKIDSLTNFFHRGDWFSGKPDTKTARIAKEYVEFVDNFKFLRTITNCGFKLFANLKESTLKRIKKVNFGSNFSEKINSKLIETLNRTKNLEVIEFEYQFTFLVRNQSLFPKKVYLKLHYLKTVTFCSINLNNFYLDCPNVENLTFENSFMNCSVARSIRNDMPKLKTFVFEDNSIDDLATMKELIFLLERNTIESYKMENLNKEKGISDSTQFFKILSTKLEKNDLLNMKVLELWELGKENFHYILPRLTNLKKFVVYVYRTFQEKFLGMINSSLISLEHLDITFENGDFENGGEEKVSLELTNLKKLDIQSPLSYLVFSPKMKKLTVLTIGNCKNLTLEQTESVMQLKFSELTLNSIENINLSKILRHESMRTLDILRCRSVTSKDFSISGGNNVILKSLYVLPYDYTDFYCFEKKDDGSVDDILGEEKILEHFLIGIIRLLKDLSSYEKLEELTFSYFMVALKGGVKRKVKTEIRNFVRQMKYLKKFTRFISSKMDSFIREELLRKKLKLDERGGSFTTANMGKMKIFRKAEEMKKEMKFFCNSSNAKLVTDTREMIKFDVNLSACGKEALNYFLTREINVRILGYFYVTIRRDSTRYKMLKLCYGYFSYDSSRTIHQIFSCFDVFGYLKHIQLPLNAHYFKLNKRLVWNEELKKKKNPFVFIPNVKILVMSGFPEELLNSFYERVRLMDSLRSITFSCFRSRNLKRNFTEDFFQKLFLLTQVREISFTYCNFKEGRIRELFLNKNVKFHGDLVVTITQGYLRKTVIEELNERFTGKLLVKVLGKQKEKV